MSTKWNFGAYLVLLKAWLSSKQNLTIGQAVEYAVESAAALWHIDLSTPYGALVLSIVEGLILSPVHHEENGGPVTTPAQAVALAIQVASNHTAVPASWDQAHIERPEAGDPPADEKEIQTLVPLGRGPIVPPEQTHRTIE